MEVRVRFAPSRLDICMLVDYAQHYIIIYLQNINNGKIILRIEDTDRTRFVEVQWKINPLSIMGRY
jgi:hypothetical protein